MGSFNVPRVHDPFKRMLISISCQKLLCRTTELLELTLHLYMAICFHLLQVLAQSETYNIICFDKAI